MCDTGLSRSSTQPGAHNSSPLHRSGQSIYCCVGLVTLLLRQHHQPAACSNTGLHPGCVSARLNDRPTQPLAASSPSHLAHYDRESTPLASMLTRRKLRSSIQNVDRSYFCGMTEFSSHQFTELAALPINRHLIASPVEVQLTAH